MKLNRQALFLIILLVIAPAIGLLSFMYFSSFVTINIAIDSEGKPLTAVLYSYDHDNEEISEAQNTIALMTFTASGNYRVKKGTYIFTNPATEDFKKTSQIITVGKNDERFTVKPDYSTEKLNSLLQAENPIIDRMLVSKYPAISQKFSIELGKLYNRGEWYATRLVSNEVDPTNNDSLKVVFRKQAEAWAIITIPPDIFISHVKYPQIPRHILVDLNQ